MKCSDLLGRCDSDFPHSDYVEDDLVDRLGEFGLEVELVGHSVAFSLDDLFELDTSEKKSSNGVCLTMGAPAMTQRPLWITGVWWRNIH